MSYFVFVFSCDTKMLLRTLKLWILGMECTWRKVTCRYSEEQKKKKISGMGWILLTLSSALTWGKKKSCFSDFSFSLLNSSFPAIHQPFCPLYLLWESVFRLFFSKLATAFPWLMSTRAATPPYSGSGSPASASKDHSCIFQGNMEFVTCFYVNLLVVTLY